MRSGRSDRYFVPNNHTVLASVEAFDVNAGVWRDETPLPEPRERMAVAAAQTGLYVLGGCAAARPGAQECDVLLSTVLFFSPRETASGKWTAAAPLPTSNAWFGAAVLGEHLYAVGGGLFYGRNATFRLNVGVGAL